VSGRFERSDPQPTSSNGAKQLGNATSGSRALVTGAVAGSHPNANDLDGVTTVRSAPIALPSAAGQQLTFRYVFAHGANSSSADSFVASIEAADGTRTPVFSVAGSATDVDGAWRSVARNLDAWAGQTVRIVFRAADVGSASLVEVEIDDVRVTRGA
jgi:aminopeptidase S